jgi:hypothetical protein
MELTGNSVKIQVNPAELEDDQLIGLAQEISDVARERGLELPYATGVVAVEGATRATDTEVSTTDIKESLAQQMLTASKGYKATIDTLNDGRRKRDILPEATHNAITAEFEEWLTEDKLAYVVTAQEADSDVRFTLVATPNVVATKEDLVKAAKAFGENQPYTTYVWDELYKKYIPEQLSGTDPGNGNSVVFSLIPSSYTPDMEGTVVEQRAKLAELQASNPGLKVPSPLEAVAYWQTLRAVGDQLADGSTFDRTYIRHFDLPERRLDGWLGVPRSYVSDVGRPVLDDSGARSGDGARLAVG